MNKPATNPTTTAACRKPSNALAIKMVSYVGKKDVPKETTALNSKQVFRTIFLPYLFV